MKKNKVGISFTILFMFLFIFVFVCVTNTNANSINKNSVFKSIKKVNSMGDVSLVYKEQKIKSIMDSADKNDLKIYEKWINGEFDRTIKLLNDKIEKDGPVGESKTYSSTLDDGTLVSVTVEDVEVNEDGSLKAEPQTNVLKKYGNRRYTYTVTVLTTSINLINGYTISDKGLTTRYVETSHSSIIVGVDLISVKWEKTTAKKIGDKINSQAQWKISVPIISGTKVQKAYMKIVKWDKTKKEMLVGQTGSWD